VVYVWADGMDVKAGLEDTKAALLVVIGALTTGQKVVLAVENGQRESKASWGAVLRDLCARGLKLGRCPYGQSTATTGRPDRTEGGYRRFRCCDCTRGFHERIGTP
jgi:hypothetical protein